MRKVSMKRRSKKDKKDAGGKNVQENGVDRSNEEDKEDKQTDSENEREEHVETEKKKKRKTESPANNKNKENSAEPEKKKKKEDKRKSVSFSRKNAKEEEKQESEKETTDDENESQFEVEAILDEKKVKGVRQYLIRWKGYGPESDTWEPESTLNCEELIKEFHNSAKEHQSPKKTKKKEKPDKKEKKDVKDWDENEQFEVDRILEVHFKRNGEREFLVSWKGYPQSESTWEPEENLECPDLIKKFMAKVEQAKNIDQKELREYRTPTKRLVLNMQEQERRLSRRLRGKQRVQYHDAE